MKFLFLIVLFFSYKMSWLNIIFGPYFGLGIPKDKNSPLCAPGLVFDSWFTLSGFDRGFLSSLERQM